MVFSPYCPVSLPAIFRSADFESSQRVGDKPVLLPTVDRSGRFWLLAIHQQRGSCKVDFYPALQRRDKMIYKVMGFSP